MSCDTKEKRVLSCDTKEKRVLSCDTKKINNDEVVSSFLLECLSVCKKISISVGFFFLIK